MVLRRHVTTSYFYVLLFKIINRIQSQGRTEQYYSVQDVFQNLIIYSVSLPLLVIDSNYYFCC